MRIQTVFVLAPLFLAATPAVAQEVSEAQAQAMEARYPDAWEVEVPQGTVLDAIRKTYERRLARVPSRDLEDQSPYPLWFRAYLRDQLTLPLGGTYQYPRVAAQILEWMLAHPNLQVPPSNEEGEPRAHARMVTTGSNVNITNLDEGNSESFIAVDTLNPQYLIAGSNNITGSGRQKQFFSVDGGSTWTTTELPLATGSAFQSDPALAWSTDGTAWAATLGINGAGNQIQVQIYKSIDRGAIWSFVSTVSSGSNNDKELMWIDTHPASPFKDNIYLAWDVPGSGMRFARSTDRGATWSTITTLSSDSAIGAHLTTGPAGELYVAWPDTASRELRVRKSIDGGATFSTVQVIATTNDSYEVSVPAMCGRKILIYLAIGADTSGGPRNGWVYSVWSDRNGNAADPGCAGIASDSNANVYFSRSSDGGTTWSAPAIIHSNPVKTDQFNPWMAVDPDDGTVQVAFYDTRDNPGRKQAHLYSIFSTDGGTTWIDETRVTSDPTDETITGADLGNQFGDYNGLAAYRGVAHPIWTDRRIGVPGDKEQIFTARLERGGKVNLGLCARQPWLCNTPELVDGGLILNCPVRGCFNIDPIPRSCLVSFSCPGCSPGGLCPPYYHIFLEDLDPAWQVGIVDVNGEEVPFELRRQPNGVVVSFRPDKELFLDKQIGDYYLIFKMGRSGVPGKEYRVKTQLKTTEQRIAVSFP